MPFPNSPTNGQQATVNGITYTYISTKTAWQRSASSANSIAVSGNITTGNILTDGYYYANGAVLSFTASSVINGTSNLVVRSGGNVTVSVGGTANVAVFTTTGVTATGLTTSAATVTGGTINGTSIGATTASTGSFTTLAASSTFTATSGTINGVSVGATTASTGRFTTLTATSTFTATSGTIDGISVGATTASTGRFTSLAATIGTASTGVSTGALLVTGGAGVSGNVYASAIYSNSGFYWAGNGAAYSTGGSSGSTFNTLTANTGVFTGNASSASLSTVNMLEKVTVSASALTGTYAYDCLTQSIVYVTANASADFTLNFRGSSTTSLNTAMAIGQSIAVVIMLTNSTTAYYPNAYQVDGVSQTVKWQGGTAPTGGNASAIDIYSYTIVKTASATYTVFGSQTKFA